MNIEYVGYRVTELCNAGQACKSRCFSVENGTLYPDPTLDEIQQGLFRLRNGSVRAVNIMGGEPTRRGDLADIVRCAHELGFETVLSTNTLQLSRELLERLAPHLHWVSISLDADTAKINDGLRGPGQFAAAKRTIGWIAEEQFPFRLKVNTQVSAVNLNNLDNIPDVFMKKVLIWKLLQWTPRADARKVADRYAIDSQMYDTLVSRQRALHPTVTIVERPYPEPDPDTVIVRPGGDLEVNAGLYDYQVVGNIFRESPQDVLVRAGVIYSNLATANSDEHTASYPS